MRHQRRGHRALQRVLRRPEQLPGLGLLLPGEGPQLGVLGRVPGQRPESSQVVPPPPELLGGLGRGAQPRKLPVQRPRVPLPPRQLPLDLSQPPRQRRGPLLHPRQQPSVRGAPPARQGPPPSRRPAAPAPAPRAQQPAPQCRGGPPEPHRGRHAPPRGALRLF